MDRFIEQKLQLDHSSVQNVLYVTWWKWNYINTAPYIYSAHTSTREFLLHATLRRERDINVKKQAVGISQTEQQMADTCCKKNQTTHTVLKIFAVNKF